MSLTTSSTAESTPDDEAIIDAGEFDGPDFLTDPYPLYRRLRTYHPVYHDRLHNQWHVTRYWDLVEVLRDEEAFGTRPHSYETDGVLGPTMLSLGGAEHAEQRNLVGDALVGKKLDAFTPIVREVARSLVETFADRGQVNLTQEFTSQLPIRVIMTMLGLPMEDFLLFQRWYKEFMMGMGWADDTRATALQAIAEYEEYMTPFLEVRRRNLGEDLTSRLIREGVPDPAIKTFVSLLLSGGGETTDKSMGNMWLNVLQQPELVARLEADHSLLDHYFSETMRHSPPVHREDRGTTRDVELAGTLIPYGAVVRLWLAAGNRDETVFVDPNRFDPSRGDLYSVRDLRAGYSRDGLFGHLGFGLGRHFCIGYQLARREAIVGAEELLRVMKSPRLSGEQMDTIRGRKRDGSIRSVGDLLVEFDRR